MSAVEWIVSVLLAGAVFGTAIAYALFRRWKRAQAQLCEAVLEETQRQKAQESSVLIAELKTAFAALSRDALSSNTDDFLKLAEMRLQQQTLQSDQELNAKKRLIDARLEEMSARLAELNGLVQSAEKQRAESHGSLAGRLEQATQVTQRLQTTTERLREALANPHARGQWGERMAEDVLRLAGLVEGVNYRKQKGTESGRPDFTFLLPGNQCVHMDVKFPLTNYLRALDATDDSARAASTGLFLKDVRLRIKEVRAYVDPSAGTLDCVLVFIPNEQVYGFIHAHDPELLDDALRGKVVLCSPVTLFAVLAVLRQSVDAFRLHVASREILELLARFREEWENYVKVMSSLGRKLEDASDEYRKLMGVRADRLDRQLEKIEQLRVARDEVAVSKLRTEPAPGSDGRSFSALEKVHQ